MYPASRVLLFASRCVYILVFLDAKAAELPPIFAPPPGVPAAIPAPPRTADVAPGVVSNRVRMLISHASERILAATKPFDFAAPSAETSREYDLGTSAPRTDAVMLPRYVVKSIVPRREEVRLPDLPRIRPKMVEREGRPGLINGFVFQLWRSADENKMINLNVLDFAGSGVDHAKEFGRVELEFKIRF